MNIARMGDLLQSSPLIAGLKNSEPDVELTLLVSAAFKDTAAGLPGIDRLMTISLEDVVRPLIVDDGGIKGSYRLLRDLTDELKSLRFDRVINITHSEFSSALTSLVAGKSSTGINLDSEGYRIVNGAWANYYFNSCLNRTFNRFNLVDLHCRMGSVKPGGRMRFDIDDDSRHAADDILASDSCSGKVLIGLVPGASTPEKKLPLQTFAETVAEIRNTVQVTALIFGAGSDAESGRQLSSIIPDSLDLCGKTDIGQLAALIERCDLLISNDTGPMHMAASVGTKVLDVSLGSALSHETAPYGEGHIIIEPRIQCYPCNPRVRCGHQGCHEWIDPAIIANLAVMILNNDLSYKLTDNIKFYPVNIYRTTFDKDGWWELEPLLQRPLSRMELFSLALREMWKCAFDDGCAWKAGYTERALQFGEMLRGRYSGTEFGESIDWATEALSHLVDLAESGKRLADELTGIASDISDIDRISMLGDQIKKVDMGLIRLSYENRELMPLVAQFVYGKDNMTGNKLDSLAKQTRELYSKLSDWGRALPEWMTRMIAGFKVEECVV